MCAGHLAGAYGIKGWLRVHSYTEPPDNLFRLRDWRLGDGPTQRKIAFVEWRAHGKGFVARIEGSNDRGDAERLRGSKIWVPADALPDLDDGEYYWRELIGLRVYSEHEGSELLLGAVHSLLETGANDVLVLQPCEGSIDRRERLLPWVPGDIVANIDIPGGRLTVRWHPED